ncbi:MAG: SDR family NAD(P)-dependent oxidoreductase [Opitutaceae bacterium]|nr:SDR family NAD(P)-dependent oxidoreductase [Opitutaceae bacterium]
MSDAMNDLPADAIAIVGMAGRFPGAADVDALWELLCAGREGLTRGDAPSGSDSRFVPVSGQIANHDCFDAAFFGVNSKEAEVLDPQHRVFFECGWTALENAGIDPSRFDGSVGVFGGASLNTYLLYNLVSNPRLLDQVGVFGAAIASDKDALTQRMAYALNLRGPAVTVQTACSTSLVAVQLACQSLQNFQCDLALAGGVSIKVPHGEGYRYTEGGVASPDGHCRPFDAAAQGTVPASGCGVVALRRLEDAVAAGDNIVAVIRGAAVNNDGAGKVGFTAPAVDGQAEVISMALATAGVEASSLGFVEAHGTATPLGDPIEVAALRQVFDEADGERCALGSIKSNIGHLDAAAGVAGLIKAALAVRHGSVPPTVHFTQANGAAQLDRSPFVVSGATMAWPVNSGPRRAGVSSFGIGGTNAHVVLEQAAERKSIVGGEADTFWLPVSARTEPALSRMVAQLADWLESHPVVRMADVAFTLQQGRRAFAVRRVVRASSQVEAIAVLRAPAVAPTDAPEAVRDWAESTEGNWPETEVTSGQTVALPTYAFERTRFWVEPGVAKPPEAVVPSKGIETWTHRAAWRVTRSWPESGCGEILDLAEVSAGDAIQRVKDLAVKGTVRELVILVDGVLGAVGEAITAPELRAVAGFALAVRHEFPDLSIRYVDAGGIDGPARLEAARRELGSPSDEAVVAWAKGQRWVRDWSPVPVATAGTWRERGVYLISGGFGRLGLALAEELARACRARLVLIGRRGGAGVEERIRKIETLGAEILTVAGDVADAQAMRVVVTDAETRWGAVHGVIHAAGLTGPESVRAVAETDAAMMNLLATAKVDGWRALDAALGHKDLDFRIAISSVVTVVGGAGLAAYAAANATMEAMVEQSAARADGTAWTSVAWGGQSGDGGMDGIKAAEILRRIVARGEAGTWVVVPGDLRALGSPGGLGQDTPAAALGSSPEPVPPPSFSRAEAERALSEIWLEALGVAAEGLDQNFFEAGGDSLSAVQIVARVNARFGSEITVAEFLDTPTVAEVAVRLVPEVVGKEARPADEPRARRGALRRQRRERGGA